MLHICFCSALDTCTTSIVLGWNLERTLRYGGMWKLELSLYDRCDYGKLGCHGYDERLLRFSIRLSRNIFKLSAKIRSVY